MRHLLCVIALAALVFSTLVLAQTDRASIMGTVTDSSGAVVPGVQVTTRNVETTIQNTTTSNEAGIYQILNLPIGRYTITFSRDGFKKVERSGIALQIAQVLKLDITMDVGAVTEVVNVTGEAPLLDTASTQVGAGLVSSVITDLPLNIKGGRSLETFAYATVPSVEGDNWTSHIAGSMAFTKEVLIDGTSAVVQIGGHIGESSPPMEAIQEFKVETGGVRAEDGRTGGGVYKFTMKSGTNDVHGSAFGFFRTESLNANTWMNNASGRQRDPDNSRTYGTSLGGPIRKNKTFIFGAFEKYTQEDFRLGTYSLNMPVPAFLDGNFGALLDTSKVLGTDALGRPVYSGEIFDPSSQRAVTAGAVDPVTGITAVRNGTVRDGFGFDKSGNAVPGSANVIPGGRISKISKNITDIFRKYYLPTREGLINNAASTAANTTWFHQTQWTTKLDHNFLDKHHLSGHFVWTERPRQLVDQGSPWNPDLADQGGGPLGNNRLQNVSSRRLAANHSYTITPTTINVLSFTFGRYRNPSEPFDNTTNWPQQLGFPNKSINNFPRVSFGSAVNGVSTSTVGNQWTDYYLGNTFIWNDTLSMVKGKHTLKFGGDFRAMQLNSHGGSPRLNFSFSPDQTGLPSEKFASAKAGFGFASFLLGAAANGSQGVRTDYYGRRKALALFAQDDWKITPELTLSLDLRWEMTTPYREKYGRWSTFSTTTQSKSFGIPGTVVFLNSGDQTFESERDWKEFAPHVGLSYQLNNRVVLRGAYGIFYSPIGMNYWSGVPYGWSPGYYGNDTIIARGDKLPAFNWDSGYPGNFRPPIQDPDYVPWGPVSVDPKTLFAGYTHNWNIGVQFEALKGTKVEINYVANVGRRLHGGNLKGNQPDQAAYTKWMKTTGSIWNGVWDTASAAKEGVPYPFAGYNSYAFAALAPYPQIWQNWNWPDNIYFVGERLGTSDYNAMQLAVTRVTNRGLTVNASYTWAAAHSNVQSTYGGFDETWETTAQLQTLSPEWIEKESHAPIFYDQAHVLKGVLSYELPIGRGRRFGSSFGRTADMLAGGWNISGSFRYNTGSPIGVNSNNYYPGWYGAIYAAVDGSADLSRQFKGQLDFANRKNPTNTYFRAAAFTNPANGEFAQRVKYRSDFRGFGFSDEQISVMKNFWIRERMRAQFRMEFYNIFNRHHFANPDTNIASPTFGNVLGMTTDAPRQGQIGLRFEF